MHDPVVDVRAAQAVVGKERVRDRRHARAGHVGKLDVEVQVTVLGLPLQAHRAERAAAELVDARGQDPGAAGALIIAQQGRRAAVAEDRRGHDLGPRVARSGARERAAHALRGDHQGLTAGVLGHRLRRQPHQRNAARAAHARYVVLVGGGIHAVALDQAVRQRRAAERVKARGDDRADEVRLELERVDRRDRLLQELVLDPRRASLQRAAHEALAQVQAATIHAAAFEDAFGECVAGEAEALEHLLLAEGGLRLVRRQRRDARTRAPRAAVHTRSAFRVQHRARALAWTGSDRCRPWSASRHAQQPLQLRV